MPATATQPSRSPASFVISNLLASQQVQNGLIGNATALLEDLFGEIVAELARADLSNIAPRYRPGRLDKFFERLEDLFGEAGADLHRDVRQSLAQMGKAQGERAASQLAAMVEGAGVAITPAGPGINRLKAILDSDPIDGRLMREWFTGLSDHSVDQVKRQVRIGLALDETNDEMIRRVRGRHTGKYKTITLADGSKRRLGSFTGGVMQTTTRNAEAIVRTAANFVSNRAYLETYRGNEDVTQEAQFSATIDGNTTFQCAALDGETFAYDDPALPVPPLHPRCRSTLIPVIRWEHLGLTEPEETRASRTLAVDDKGKLKVTGGKQVSGKIDFEAWMREQTDAVQDAYFGPTRGKLFRDRKVSLKDLVARDGRVLPLNEL